ncbi:MAG: hypothetical protein H3Z52_05080 [archaeon]|nr:hypothetical protein [archaeon]MCP8315561.1 hypothetical protein [archaeon]MCP8320299.1 hypothetical protein [archaeon]
MKLTDEELVNEFVEGLIKGTIEARITDLRKLFSDENWQKIAESIMNFQKRIIEYQTETDANTKKQLTILTISDIIFFRTLGLYTNNVNEQHLEIAKEKIRQLEKEIEAKDNKINELMQVLGMQPPKDKKVGVL